MFSHPTFFGRRPNPLRPLFFGILGFFFAFETVSAAPDDGRTVLCFVSHKTSHGFGAHEYSAGSRLIGKWIEDAYPDQKIESRYSINWPEDPESFFKDADSVIFFCSGGGGHLVNGHAAEFDTVMRTGAGLACLHYAVEVPIGPSAKGMLAWMGGYFEADWSVNPHWKASFETYPGHPAANGLQKFQIDDEWYFHMRFVDGMKGVTPILSAIAPAETMSRPDGPHSGNPSVREAVAKGEPQHVAWTYERGDDYQKGRGFGFTGLHYHWNWEEPSFRKAVLNGVAWSARLEIPEHGIETANPTHEFLEANALEYGGEQNRKPTVKATPFTDPSLFTGGIEGPACDREGNLYAVSFGEKGNIGKISPDGKSELFVTLPEGSVGNGIRFDRKGQMYVADYAGHNILKIDPTTRKITVLAHEPRMSQPNDIAIGPDDTLYASDPNWKESTGQIWRIDPDGTVTLLAEGLGTANGIEVSPDGKKLYVNESAQRKIWSFTITPEKTLTGKTLLKEFPDHGFDGMRCDIDGNLYVTRHGKGTVVVISPKGELLQEITLPGSKPSNLCFGGKDGKTVYVTEVEHTQIVTFPAARPGLSWQRWQQ
jgi:gluconolactonase